MRSIMPTMFVRRPGDNVARAAIVLLAGSIAALINLAIAQIITPIVRAPADYPSFTWLPIWAGCLMGAIGGYSSFLILKRTVARPKYVFLWIAAGVLLLSYGLPILPIINPLPRFAGVNWGIAVTLMVMHTITAVLIVGSIIAWPLASSRAQRRHIKEQ